MKLLCKVLNERALRAWCAAEAKALGHGGVTAVHKATGVSRPKITNGIKELDSKEVVEVSQVRRKGGGRKKITANDDSLLSDLDKLIDPVTLGDPESLLRWSSKSIAKLTKELCGLGHSISERTVYRLLVAQKYSMKSNRKTNEGAKNNPDRDLQFKFADSTSKCSSG